MHGRFSLKQGAPGCREAKCTGSLTMKEYLDIVDETGNPTVAVVDMETAHREGILHRTAHVWLMRRRQGTMQVLLQKRSKTKDSFPGCYDISSAGHIPAGVEYVPSALRELKEELGLDAKAEQLRFCGDRRVCYDEVFHGRPFHDRQISRVFLLLTDVEADDLSVQDEEVESVCWMDFDACVRGVEDGTIENCIEPVELDMLRRRLAQDGLL